MTRLKLLLSYINHYKYSYLTGILFIVLTNWISVTIPEYLKKSVDLLTGDALALSENQQILYRYLMIMLLLAFCIVFVRTLSRIFFFNPGRAIEYRIKNDLFAKLMSLQKDYYDENPTGSIISRIQNDINGVRLICGFGMMQFFNILTSLSFTPYKMWLISPDLTLYVLIPIAIVFILTRIGMHFVTRNTRARMKELQKLSGFIVSSLSGIDVIKGFNLNNWNLAKFNLINKSMLKLSLKISFFRSFLMPILQNLENILKAVILAIGGYYVMQANLSIGELTAFIAYSALLAMPLMGLGWLTTIIEVGLIGIASIETILSQDTEESERRVLPKDEIEGLFANGIKVTNLTYTYPGQEKPVLDGISFTILPNQTIGVLGKIGSGKTTLVNCLNRYLRVPDGSVFIGESDLNNLNYTDVRKVVRTVSQDVFLFSDSILNNIRFGRENEEDIEPGTIDKVIVEASLSEEIARFSDKLETTIGEKGIMLSGGQKQRISLARSLMDSFDVLILDNILSAVDYETERYLLSQILQRRTAKSLLIVSHRVQALEHADHILVLDEGKIVEEGTHQALIMKPGLYQETWRLQEQEN